MAAAVEIVEGVGKGWRYLLAIEDVRVGRGAGHQIRLDDPSWGAGHLRVRFRQGGYVVTNRMGHAVLLDGNPLADGDEATWFTGVHLQPTGGTLLTLSVVERPADVEPDGGVIPIRPGLGVEQTRRKKFRDLVSAALVVLVCVGLMARGQFKATPPTLGNVLHKQLAPVLEREFPDGRGHQVVCILGQGLVFRSQKKTLAAYQMCAVARRQIADLAGQKADSPVLFDARAFVAELEADITTTTE